MEASAVKHLGNYIDESFGKIVELIYRTEGRVVVAGIGKSANIAQKMVATFNSTGTPAVFMHAADAIHGDLGVVQKGDVVICISKSGNTPEVKVLVPLVKSMGNQLIALCGNVESYLAKQANHVLNATVDQEACPHNLAPTTSTTAQLALGDALAMCLMDVRGFTSEDFARYHPGGALGKKLYTRISDLLDRTNVPSVETNSPIKEVIIEISSHRLGATAVLDCEALIGVITDGDLRRMLQNDGDLQDATAADIMNKSPKTIDSTAMAVRGFSMMEEFNITQLVVLDEDKYAGIIHLHDILKEGIY
jgi:arabinose-5-phosphate isomerase